MHTKIAAIRQQVLSVRTSPVELPEPLRACLSWPTLDASLEQAGSFAQQVSRDTHHELGWLGAADAAQLGNSMARFRAASSQWSAHELRAVQVTRVLVGERDAVSASAAALDSYRAGLQIRLHELNRLRTKVPGLRPLDALVIALTAAMGVPKRVRELNQMKRYAARTERLLANVTAVHTPVQGLAYDLQGLINTVSFARGFLHMLADQPTPVEPVLAAFYLGCARDYLRKLIGSVDSAA
ncbi:hypothetical protein [Pseudomonas typographi]|uniref:hypothetical protein n=1 Tax=Pseudomonas typographi TaxID=2715964 RepID=UPI001685BECC|nr:hypothetical protein [Pseudomonas typographi]MBD1551668.1 hypothetical protein [Pseudomonas typographi]